MTLYIILDARKKRSDTDDGVMTARETARADMSHNSWAGTDRDCKHPRRPAGPSPCSACVEVRWGRRSPLRLSQVLSTSHLRLAGTAFRASLP